MLRVRLQSMSAAAALSAVLAVPSVGCADGVEVLLSADAARGSALGETGPYGVGLLSRTLRVRGDDAIEVQLTLPLGADDAVAPGRFPMALLVQGGLVARERYQWLATHLASRGFIVAAPPHVFDLAFFSQDNGASTLQALRRADKRVGDVLQDHVDDVPSLALGHSLGGVVAAKAWFTEPTAVTHLALLASVPDPADDVSGARPNSRVLSVAGGADGLIGPDEVATGAEAFGAPHTFARVDGLTHYQYTDGASADELKKEAAPTVDTAIVRGRVQFLIDALAGDLTGDGGGDVLDHPETWPVGISPDVEPQEAAAAELSAAGGAP